MRRSLWWNLVALSAGVLFISSTGSAPRATAQEKPPEKEQTKALEDDDPFRDKKSKSEAKRETPPPDGGHQIILNEPIAEGQTLEQRLEAKVTFIAREAPLADLVEVLSMTLDGPVMLSQKKLEEAAINLETPVTYRLRNVSLKSGLRHVLGELGLTYLIKDDVLVITTPEDAGSQLATRVYDCRDLMKLPSPIRKAKQAEAPQPKSEIGAAGLTAKGPEKEEGVGPEGGYDISDLMKVITTTVTPDSWDEVGGPGSIADFKGLITISTTQDVHEQVERLLNMLHQAGGLEPKVKVSR